MKTNARINILVLVMALFGMGAHRSMGQTTELRLCNIITQADISKWARFDPPDLSPKDPDVKLELSDQGAPAGHHALKMTFAGGKFPGIATQSLPDADYFSFKTFSSDITASRPCLLVFRVIQEKCPSDLLLGNTYQLLKSGTFVQWGNRWAKVARLDAGANHVEDVFRLDPRLGKVTGLEIYAYHPMRGDSISISDIRLQTAPPRKITPFAGASNTLYMPVPKDLKVRVLGTDLALSDLMDLGKQYLNTWTKPDLQPKTTAQADGEIKTAFDEIKRTHPRAVSVIFRDGEPAGLGTQPYAGWKTCYVFGHGPASIFATRLGDNMASEPTMELYYRRRCSLLQVDLCGIPAGSKILAARLVIVRAQPVTSPNPAAQDTPMKPTMWIAEPCNREWVENEVNCFEYASGKFWKEISGMDWEGPDPDFSPTVIAFGQSTGNGANIWDFTEAVRYWNEGGHPNHGFVFYNLAHAQGDQFLGYSRQAPDVKNRPAMYVLYNPPGS